MILVGIPQTNWYIGLKGIRMKTKRIIISSMILLIGIAIVGCSSKVLDPEVMYQKGTALTYLTKKLQVIVHHGVSEPKELSAQMQKRYPEKMKEFSEYSLHMKNDNGTAVILMCDHNDSKALLEDVACGGSLEGHWFNDDENCSFHLDIDVVCNR